MYACKECGAAARVEAGAVVRSCAHTGTVVANISAHARGRSSAGQKTLRQKALDKLRVIAHNLGLGK
jgi:hypothetical protein